MGEDETEICGFVERNGGIMCKDCNICGTNQKLTPEVSVNKGLVTFNSEYHLIEMENSQSNRTIKGAVLGNDNKLYVPVYPMAKCHICGCSWITDVGGFRYPAPHGVL